MSRLLIVLGLLSLGCGDIVFRDGESAAAPPIEMFSDAELRCFLDRKVLHSDGKCYTLLQLGPCREGQWLVLDKNNTANTRNLICKDRPCNKPLRVYWPKDGHCHKLSSKNTLCPYEGNTLSTNSYGDGQCACEMTHVRAKSDILRGRNTTTEWEGHCYPLYRQQPCPAGRVLAPAYMEGHGVVGDCQADPCLQENSRPGGGGFARWEVDGRCHRLDERGPCPGREELFKIHPQTNKPRCYNTVNSLLGDSPARCDGNIDVKTDECRKELELKMENNPFVTEVTRARRVKRRG